MTREHKPEPDWFLVGVSIGCIMWVILLLALGIAIGIALVT